MSSFPYLELTLRVLLFAGWSSFWPRQFVKKRLESRVGYRAYRLTYNAGTIFLLSWSLVYLYDRSHETVQLWDLHGYAWFLPLVYLIEGTGVFFLAACTQLGLHFWGFTKPPERYTLQTGGLYKVTRHPLYWSVFCFLFGHVLALGSGLALLYFVLLEAYNVLGVVFLENRALAKQLGEEFAEFHRRTSAVPFRALVQRKVRVERLSHPLRLVLAAIIFTAAVGLVHDTLLVAPLHWLSPVLDTFVANRRP